MAIWDTSIKVNDTTLDIYQAFFDLYNQGKDPIDISKQIFEDFYQLFNDSDDRNNSLFGLALAQWETKSLDKSIFKIVKEIIETGNDLTVWRELGTIEKDIKKRKLILDKFLIQISLERDKPKRRTRPKYEFTLNEIIKLTAPDNNKTFTVSEEYTNGIYKQTGALVMWHINIDEVFIQGGRGILYFTGANKDIDAKWSDSQTLEITHDNNITFTMQEESSYFCGDKIRIIYKAKHD